MAHLQQHHFGKPSRVSYHNKEWARMMRAIGLIPSDTGQPGGREVGQKVSHYIEEGGAFARACAELVSNGFDALYIERWSEGDTAKRRKKAASKNPLHLPRLRRERMGEAEHRPGLRRLPRADGSGRGTGGEG